MGNYYGNCLSNPYTGVGADPVTMCIDGKWMTPSAADYALCMKDAKYTVEADNPWHTELRERYTLEPKMAAWKGILLIAAWCFAVNCIISLYRHLEPCAYVIALVVSAVFAPIWYFVFFWLPDKIIRWAKAS